jgi:hypothetical protein
VRRATTRGTAGPVFFMDFLLHLLCVMPEAPADPDRPGLLVLGLPARDREAVIRCLGAYRVYFPRRDLSGRLVLGALARRFPTLAVAVHWDAPAPETRDLAGNCARLGLPLWRLGANPAHPGRSFVLDKTGTPFDAEGPSDLSALLEDHDFSATAPLCEKAGHLLALLAELRRARRLERTGETVLLAGAPGDQTRLAELAGRERPGAVLERLDATTWRDPAQRDRLLGLADRVYTVNAPAGFDALIRGLPVTVLGRPFYAGRGLTDDRATGLGRRRGLTLTELFCGVELLYARYSLAP